MSLVVEAPANSENFSISIFDDVNVKLEKKVDFILFLQGSNRVIFNLRAKRKYSNEKLLRVYFIPRSFP